DLVLLDMMMPGMDGLELLDEICANPPWSELPVVFLTAARDRHLLLRAFDSGAVDYVTKPFMPEEQLARVQAHIGLKLTRELLYVIRANPASSLLPVVFLTAAHVRDLLLRSFDSGAVDYVTKPFMPEELLARVQAHIGLKLTRDRLERVARERQELVNLVAHDLKNPLSSIFFASDLLLTGQTRAERVPRYLQMIRDSAEDALGYIRRYLETQASARSQAAREPARAALPELVEWLERRYALQLEDRGARLRVLSVSDAT